MIEKWLDLRKRQQHMAPRLIVLYQMIQFVADDEEIAAESYFVNDSMKQFSPLLLVQIGHKADDDFSSSAAIDFR